MNRRRAVLASWGAGVPRVRGDDRLPEQLGPRVACVPLIGHGGCVPAGASQADDGDEGRAGDDTVFMGRARRLERPRSYRPGEQPLKKPACGRLSGGGSGSLLVSRNRLRMGTNRAEPVRWAQTLTDSPALLQPAILVEVMPVALSASPPCLGGPNRLGTRRSSTCIGDECCAVCGRVGARWRAAQGRARCGHRFGLGPRAFAARRGIELD